MDSAVARAMAKWPNVPAVYGWLALDRRGNWLIRTGTPPRFERIANEALREFIARNYAADDKGRWYFQNGPQRVYVNLAYTPLVVHYEGDELRDHCRRAFAAGQAFEDEEGSVLFEGESTIALLDDRDLLRFTDAAPTLQRIKRSEIGPRYRFATEPKPD